MRTVASSSINRGRTVKVSQTCLIKRTHEILLNMGSPGLHLDLSNPDPRGKSWESAWSNFPGDSYDDQASLRTLISG